ncbi:hypothetical protein LIER_20791 [Lithospermum erythrorhizon]|uniref:Uncharacterized protein n=1 Tax=Lithospermum erythrorhizon TaxID=34254 RepID=A0AAV3QRV8_LITER
MLGLDPNVAIHHLIDGVRPIKQAQRKFRPGDLNQACSKDDFPLPIPELMIDATIGHETLTIMDGFSGYNQI